MSESRPAILLPAREIPVPTSVSAEAQAVMAMPAMEQPEFPPVDDVDAWRVMIADHDRAIAALMAERMASAAVKTEELDLDGLRVYEITPIDVSDDDQRVYLEIHGGAFVHGAGESCRAMAVGTAMRVGARVWAVDYRMPPDFRSRRARRLPRRVPSAVRSHEPNEIIVGGASAGGNLAAALTLHARDEGLPLPAAVVLLTPGVDLTRGGDSLQTNLGLDPLITERRVAGVRAVRGGSRPHRPVHLAAVRRLREGFSAHDLDHWAHATCSCRTPCACTGPFAVAGVRADLHVTEAGGHGGFFGMAPEDPSSKRRSASSSTSTGAGRVLRWVKFIAGQHGGQMPAASGT